MPFAPEPSHSYVLRMGKTVQADSAFLAWTSRDIQAMTAVLDCPTNHIDRHFLLQTLVAETYKKRGEVKMRLLCLTAGNKHLSELPNLIVPLIKDLGTVPRITTLPHMATVLCEDGEYDLAIEVCQLGIQLGLSDGTKSGFEGRMARIRKLNELKRTRSQNDRGPRK